MAAISQVVNVPVKMVATFYSIQEVAEMLKVDHKVIRAAIDTGELEAFRVGRQWRISQESLRLYTTASN